MSWSLSLQAGQLESALPGVSEHSKCLLDNHGLQQGMLPVNSGAYACRPHSQAVAHSLQLHAVAGICSTVTRLCRKVLVARLGDAEYRPKTSCDEIVPPSKWQPDSPGGRVIPV